MIRRLAPLVLLVTLLSCRRTESVSGPDMEAEDPIATTVSVSPISHTFASIGESRAFSASVLDQAGSPIVGAVVSWETSDSAVTTITSEGMAIAAGPGAASLVATSGTISASADAIVSQVTVTLVVSTQILTLRGVGDSTLVTVSAEDANGNPIVSPMVTWSWSDSSVVAVNGEGTIVAGALGTALVYAVSGEAVDTIAVSVIPFVATADIQLTKSVAAAPTTFGDTVTYTIEATNLGPDEATNVVLRDSLPTSLSYLSHMTSVGDYEVASGLWTVATLSVNDTVRMDLSAVVVAAGMVSNAVSVESQDQVDPVIGNDVSTAPTPVAPDTVASTLQISVDDLAPLEGDTVTFTLTYENAGPDQLPTVDVANTLPAGLTLVSTTPSDGSYVEPVWTLPALPLNTPATLQISASVDGGTAGQALPHVANVEGVATHFDATLVDDSASVTIAVAFEVLAVTTLSLPNGAPAVAYDQTLSATGGDSSYSWAVTVGSLPTGLILNGSTGQITGTPTGSTAAFTVTATSGDGQADAQALSITINAALNIATSSLGNGVRGSTYSASVISTGGDGNNTWSVTSGTLPGGMTLNATTGALGGVPGSNGTFNFTVRVVSDDGQSDTQALQISVFTQLQVTTTSPLPNACCSGTYQFQLQATGGAFSYTWSLSSGGLPGGWTLSSSGLISGPQSDQNGPTFNFIVRVISGDGQSDTQSLSVTFVIG